ncbi:hypothetical protein Mapa_007343 [Marchantia paleacea]|nr:hypothetical protein Mapa_007343 [Marchantia paleacea]
MRPADIHAKSLHQDVVRGQDDVDRSCIDSELLPHKFHNEFLNVQLLDVLAQRVLIHPLPCQDHVACHRVIEKVDVKISDFPPLRDCGLLPARS